MILRPLVLLAAILLLSEACFSEEPIDFEKDVLPVLEEHCLACHARDEAQAGLRLGSMFWALKGGDSGEKAIEPGESQKSYLFQRITSSDDANRMPPDSEPLTTDEIEIPPPLD